MAGWDSARETAIFGYPVIQCHSPGYPCTITSEERIQSGQGCLSDDLRIRLLKVYKKPYFISAKISVKLQ